MSERLWSRVERNPDTGCWEWTGYRDSRGYGQMNVAGRPTLTHRLAWELAHGEPVADRHICHRCDNPACCNPMHIYAGTPSDNAEDKTLRGRARGNTQGGEAHYRTALTAADVVRIRALWRDGWTLTELAAEFAVGRSGVHAIVANRTWKDLMNGRPA